MRIGILTFHYAHNYGAVLQAYALKEFLNNNGNKAEIINYRNSCIENRYRKKLAKELTLKNAIHFKQIRKYILQELDYFFEQPSWRKQNKKFRKFIVTYLENDLNKIVDKNTIGSLKYDLIISGSDQVWNKSITNGYDDIYFLNFKTKAKKAFYAISDGNFEITDDNLIYYKFILKDVEFISTRESTLSEDIKRKIFKEAYSVADPSFLLSKTQYIKAFNLREKKKILFAYFVVEDPFMSQIVKVIAKALKLEILELHYYKKRFLKEKYMHADLGPIDFLEGIYNAGFIVTNSFHGIAFSIIFNKQFYCVYNNDARKDSLLKSFDLHNRKIQKYTDLDLNLNIDYSKLELDRYIENSKKYISLITL